MKINNHLFFIFFTIQLVLSDKQFIVEQNEQSFLKFTPDECYYYNGMSVKVTEEGGQPTFKFYISGDCTGNEIDSSMSSPLIRLMNNVKINAKIHFKTPTSFFSAIRIIS